MNFDYSSGYDEIFNRTVKVISGTHIKTKKAVTKEDRFSSFSNDESQIVIFPSDHSLWRLWIMMSDKDDSNLKMNTVKLLGNGEMKGLNMFGFSPERFGFIGADDSGPLVWLLSRECMRFGLSFLLD